MCADGARPAHRRELLRQGWKDVGKVLSSP